MVTPQIFTRVFCRVVSAEIVMFSANQ